ncbi:hypothetical protein BJ912DRAFT_1059794 [Pholiota molesta]|nr:hypothetical protein BJ912DRAFT_1059794 [Pholiota molesta]
MPTPHSVSLSDLPGPFFESIARRPAFMTPIALTQIGQIRQPLKPQPVGRAQTKTGSSRHSIASTPYPKPILKGNASRTPTHSPPQVDSPPAASRRVSLMTKSSRGASPAPSNPQSDANDISSEEDTTDSEGGLIDKPEGEVTRTSRGGYNLEFVLGWDRKKYRKIRAYVKNLAEEHLDCSQSFTSQALRSVQTVKNLALERFPELQEYKDCWPVIDMLRMQLKYSSSRARHESIMADAETEQLRRNSRKSLRNNK